MVRYMFDPRRETIEIYRSALEEAGWVVERALDPQVLVPLLKR